MNEKLIKRIEEKLEENGRVMKTMLKLLSLSEPNKRIQDFGNIDGSLNKYDRILDNIPYQVGIEISQNEALIKELNELNSAKNTK